MKVFLDGHDFEFATQQIYMCMFPNSHAEFVPEKPVGGDYIVSRVRRREEEICSETEINLSGEISVGTVNIPIAVSCDGEDEKRAVRRAIKTSFYNAAVQFTSERPQWGALTGIRPSKVAAKYLDEGRSESETVALMEEEYFVSETRARLATDCAVRAKKLAGISKPNDFSLYVGIPFCASRCRYCSFVSHSVEKAGHLIEPYLRMLEKELSVLGEAAGKSGLSLKSVYIGGGTPTAISAKQLEFVMRTIADNFDIATAGEYTVEGGRPDTITPEKIKIIKQYGATRISVNPQTMNDEILAAMDRRHTAEDVIRTVHEVKNEGGLIINTDLIAGLPGDNFESFRSSLDRVLAFEPENITVHTLAVKRGSTLARENYLLPQDAETGRMVDYALKTVTAGGYVPYYLYRQKYMSGNLENVGYSKPGRESDYNNYIMDELHTILSAGAGGVTKLIDRSGGRIERIFNPKYPYEYNNAEEKIKQTSTAISEFFVG
ncbi:MAG: coproporphyrinogen dehydrogenase HemZ [Oscillospiraceae bacterium]|nr:coproporphyrinogen dehydrogenase HemZ [Oscillospiraceae bacterium]